MRPSWPLQRHSFINCSYEPRAWHGDQFAKLKRWSPPNLFSPPLLCSAPAVDVLGCRLWISNLQLVLHVALGNPDQFFHLLDCALDLTVAAAFTLGTFLRICLHLRRLLLEEHHAVFPNSLHGCRFKFDCKSTCAFRSQQSSRQRVRSLVLHHENGQVVLNQLLLSPGSPQTPRTRRHCSCGRNRSSAVVQMPL